MFEGQKVASKNEEVPIGTLVPGQEFVLHLFTHRRKIKGTIRFFTASAAWVETEKGMTTWSTETLVVPSTMRFPRLKPWRFPRRPRRFPRLREK